MSQPTDEHRITVIGRTGSGKSVLACDILQRRSWMQIPWIIADYKREKLIGQIGQAVGRKYFSEREPKDILKHYPKTPGIHRVICHPGDNEDVEAMMLRIWERGNTGFYIDEGFMLPQALPKWKAYTNLLVQGRSLHIPMLMLYQKPLWMNTFAKGQADFFAIMALNNEDDAAEARKLAPPVVLPDGRKVFANAGLPKYHAIWYDVGEGQSSVLRPARKPAQILEAFSAKARGYNPEPESEAKNRAVLL